MRRLLGELGTGREPSPLGRRPVCTGCVRRPHGRRLENPSKARAPLPPGALAARSGVRRGSRSRWVLSGRGSDWSHPAAEGGAGRSRSGNEGRRGGDGEVSRDGGGSSSSGSSAKGAYVKISISGSFLLRVAWPLSPESWDPRTLGTAPPCPVFSQALPRPVPGLTGFFQILLDAPTSLQHLACQPRSALYIAARSVVCSELCSRM